MAQTFNFEAMNFLIISIFLLCSQHFLPVSSGLLDSFGLFGEAEQKASPTKRKF